jgi:hypothetical protein
MRRPTGPSSFCTAEDFLGPLEAPLNLAFTLRRVRELPDLRGLIPAI